MKRIIIMCFFFTAVLGRAQVTYGDLAKYPVFPECQETEHAEREYCFNRTLQTFIYSNFEMPEDVVEKNFKGKINVLFEVDNSGVFKVIYVDGAFEVL